MAIDVLSAADTTPIVVGDEEDIANLVAVDPPGQTEPAYLVLRNPEGGITRVALSDEASDNFLGMSHITVVALSPTDEISFAMLLPCGNKGAGRRLEEREIKAIAELLVQQDFNLLCLC